MTMDGAEATPGAAPMPSVSLVELHGKLLSGNRGDEGLGGSRRIGSCCTQPEAARIANLIANGEEKKLMYLCRCFALKTPRR